MNRINFLKQSLIIVLTTISCIYAAKSVYVEIGIMNSSFVGSTFVL